MASEPTVQGLRELSVLYILLSLLGVKEINQVVHYDSKGISLLQMEFPSYNMDTSYFYCFKSEIKEFSSSYTTCFSATDSNVSSLGIENVVATE